MNQVNEIIGKMTLEDKIKLCSGATFWETEKMEAYGIPSFFMSDGPHGLRTQKGEADHLGINQSEKSTCFPTASASAASWNPELLKKMGEAIGEEALYHGVDVVLGPGACMKRNPLCGRNFEYFSEDPYLAGVMAANWIQGVQSKGVGTSLKHFAANNQEQDRMMGNSMVDERAFREIYLPAFEMAVKEGKPDTVMCSYNKINGTFASDNKKLLTEILREEWGFDGMVVTDWGAMNDRIAAFEAGCDLEMPNSCGFFDEEVKKAVAEGRLGEEKIDACVERILKLAFKAQTTRKNAGEVKELNAEEHHELAKKIAEESAVLLKNEDYILPLSKEKKIALCGAMAETIRYQGAGSSHINPTKLTSIRASMEEKGAAIAYFPAYELSGEKNEEELKKAIEGAKEAEVVVIAAGLPDSYESEGYDRTHMQMPESHNELIHEIAKVNENVVVVLMGGSPVEMPWIGEVKAVLNLYLGGQAAGEAAADLLYGDENPSGKLAETWPVSYSDCSSSETFGVNPRQVEYAESIYVGYRYYEKAGIPVQLPFGYGLSYTTFTLSELKLSKAMMDFADEEEALVVSCKVKNTGAVKGSEVVQIYVADKTPDVFKAVKELKGFAKVSLEPGEEKEIQITLAKRAFTHYDVKSSDWEVLCGTYQIQAGTSSTDIALSEEITVKGTVTEMGYRALPDWYKKPVGKPSVSDFEKIYGKEIKPFELEKPGSFTLLNTFNDMKENPVVQQIIQGMLGGMLAAYGGDETNPEYIFTSSIVLNTPLVRLVQQGGGQTPLELMQAAVGAANGDEAALAMLAGMMGQ
ncbi:MAG: glycoside hydrolase family 3 C-terminal domain-containing protein [Oliverpabstia sp.]